MTHRRAGGLPLGSRNAVLAERRRRVAELYSSGMSAEAIAPLVSVNPQTVLNDLKATGVPVRPHGPAPGSPRRRFTSDAIVSRRNRCVRLYEKGLPATEIAMVVGVSSTLV